MLGLFIAQHAENDRKAKQLAAHLMKEMKDPAAQSINITDPNLTDFGKKVQENFVTHVVEHAFLSLKKDLTASLEMKEPIDFDRINYTELLKQEIDQAEFSRSFARTWWNTKEAELTEEHIQKLFWLARGTSRYEKSDNPTISLLTYIQILLWLGHPSFKKNIIPAPAAIDLLHEILSTNVTFARLFCGSISRVQLDQNKEKTGIKDVPHLRLNEGHLTFNENNQICFLFRNLIITAYYDQGEHHRLIFTQDKHGLIMEADESWKTRYVRRKTQPRPRDAREMDIDIRKQIAAINKQYKQLLQSLPPSSDFTSTVLANSCAMINQSYDTNNLPKGRGKPGEVVPFDWRRGLPI